MRNTGYLVYFQTADCVPAGCKALGPCSATRLCVLSSLFQRPTKLGLGKVISAILPYRSNGNIIRVRVGGSGPK